MSRRWIRRTDDNMNQTVPLFPEMTQAATISREWTMPHKNTFNIPAVANLLKRHVTPGLWLDPFANNNASKRILGNHVVTNDINTEYNTDFNMDALEFLGQFNGVDGVIFDPPYSVDQCLRRYTPIQNGTAGRAEYWAKCKDKIAQITNRGALVISFAWDSTGMGKNRGFEIIEIKLLCHGACHNDTIITVEVKS